MICQPRVLRKAGPALPARGCSRAFSSPGHFPVQGSRCWCLQQVLKWCYPEEGVQAWPGPAGHSRGCGCRRAQECEQPTGAERCPAGTLTAAAEGQQGLKGTAMVLSGREGQTAGGSCCQPCGRRSQSLPLTVAWRKAEEKDWKRRVGSPSVKNLYFFYLYSTLMGEGDGGYGLADSCSCCVFHGWQ